MFIFTFNFITIKHVVLPVSLAKQEKEEEEEEQCSQPPFSWLLYLHTYVVIKII